MDLFSSVGIDIDAIPKTKNSNDMIDTDRYCTIFHLLMKWETDMSPFLLRIYNKFTEQSQHLILKDNIIQLWIQKQNQ